MGRATRRSHNLESLMEPLEPFRNDEEVCINRPDEAWVWRKGGFQRFEIAMDAEDLIDLAHVAMAQRRADASPLPGTDIETADGRLLRFQAILPPCVRDGLPAVAIRQATEDDTTLEELASSGLFSRTRKAEQKRDIGPAMREILAHYEAEDWLAFLKGIVHHRLTVLLVGSNGTGKTHIGRALLKAVPLSERLNTLADADELSRLPHPNAVHAYYAKDGAGGRPKASKVVEAFLRMRIGRPVVGEVRDGDGAVGFLRMCASGHSGGITTAHAPTARGAIKTIRVMLRSTEDGQSMSDQDIDDHLREMIHVVIKTERSAAEGFSVPEIWFPAADVVRAA